MELLNTAGISYQLDNLIKSAEEKLIIVSPYLRIHDKLFDRIVKADERGVEIIIIYGKKELHPIQNDLIQSLKNCDIFFSENLHAKVFVNESFGVLGSMNLYDYSQINNFELGAAFYKNKHSEFYQEMLDEIMMIINLSEHRKKGEKSKKKYITNDERIAKSTDFYRQFANRLENVNMLVNEDVINNFKKFEFSGSIPGSNKVEINNKYGFLHVECDNQIEKEHILKAQKIATEIDHGNRLYEHNNGFSIYDPKGAGPETFLDDGDAIVISRIIKYFANL